MKRVFSLDKYRGFNIKKRNLLGIGQGDLPLVFARLRLNSMPQETGAHVQTLKKQEYGYVILSTKTNVVC